MKKIKQNRAVAFIDVLGFKNMINSYTASELGNKYKQATFNSLEKYKFNVDLSNELSFFPELHKNKEDYCLSYMFSDSIILTSHDAREESCLKLLIFVFKLTRAMIIQGFPLRGAVSFGDMFADAQSSVFVGQALTEAYELEMKQEWIGVTIHDNLVKAFPKIFNNQKHLNLYCKFLFVKYPVPMKKGLIKDEYTVNWRFNIISKEGTKKLFPTSKEWSGQRKIENTLAYAKYIRERGFAYLQSKTDCPVEIRTFFVSDVEPNGSLKHGDEY